MSNKPNKDYLWAVAWAVVLVMSTFWMLGRLAPLPGRIQFLPLSIAVILVLCSAGLLISHLRAASTRIRRIWAGMLPFFAPIVVWAIVGSVWAHWHEKANRRAIYDELSAVPAAPPAAAPEAELEPMLEPVPEP